MLIDRLVTFDTETTGVDTTTARIVTAYVGVVRANGQIVEEREWVIDPGVEVPEGAAKIHGYTTERVRAEGKPAKESIEGILNYLYGFAGLPLVVYNAPYDLTLLGHEMRRHFGEHQQPYVPAVVVDPMVLDKALEPYRKGGRTLAAVAKHHRVTVGDLHDARADSLMAAALAFKLLEHERYRHLDGEKLHAKTRATRFAQMKSYREYLIGQGDHEKAATVDPQWPIRWTDFGARLAR